MTEQTQTIEEFTASLEGLSYGRLLELSLDNFEAGGEVTDQLSVSPHDADAREVLRSLREQQQAIEAEIARREG